MLDFKKKYIGFDLGSNKIKWIIYGGNKKNPVVYDWGIVNTPREAIKYGRLINKESLKEVISPIVEGSKMKISGAAITLSCPEMVVRIIKLPKVNNKELDQVIRYEIEQYIPENYTDYIVDYKVLGEFNGEEGKILKVLMTAIPTSIIQSYLELMAELNLKTIKIDFHGNSINRFLTASIKELEEKTYTVLDLGFLTTTITVMEQGKPVFTRLIQNGNDEITASIANSFNLSLEEAEEYLINKGGLLLENEERIGDLEQELASSIKPAFDYILNNVFHSLEFYKSMSSNVAEGFIIVGGGSYLKNSNDYSSEYLNLKAINFSDNLTLNGLESVDLRKLPFLANVLGLVFHQDKDINLLPEDYKRQHAEQKSKKYRIIGIALSLVLIATALYLPRYFVESLKNKRINVEQEITSKLEYEDLKKLEENLQKDIERRTRLIASFQASYLKWSEVLAEIGSNVPQGLAIDSLTYSEDLEISGQAESYNLVAQFIVNLNNMDIISEVQPLSVFDFDGIYQFKIKCFIEGEGKNEAD